MKKMMIVLTILFAFAPLAQAGNKPATSDPHRFRGGIRNSPGERRLNVSQLGKVTDSLRNKTGFQEMRFDDAGFLVLGNRMNVVGGSASARELLIAAADSARAFELEAKSHSQEVAFAHITEGTAYSSFQTKVLIEVRQIRLDFADFKQLRGEREVIAAFDLGFAILHELAHGVLGLTDAVGETGQLGDCDGLINRMRRELNLPERQGYSARIQANQFSQTGVTRLAELVFVMNDSGSGRDEAKRFYLRWEAKQVIGLPSSKQAALIQYR
ncbi:MAG: hypothetical protein SF097_07325 [Acidobacteriota bacterium]|nr:hypothetical protein [Acidobacteriota bacterium]